jgi:hypothetical protein
VDRGIALPFRDLVDRRGEWSASRPCRFTPAKDPGPNIVRVRKSRIRWTGHVARMGRGEACTGFCWGNMSERDHWGDPGVDGRVKLR